MLKSNVSELMEIKGITVRALEEKAKISHVTILRTRSNIENCRLDTLVKIANALECTVNDLFTDQPDSD